MWTLVLVKDNLPAMDRRCLFSLTFWGAVVCLLPTFLCSSEVAATDDQLTSPTDVVATTTPSPPETWRNDTSTNESEVYYDLHRMLPLGAPNFRSRGRQMPSAGRRTFRARRPRRRHKRPPPPKPPATPIVRQESHHHYHHYYHEDMHRPYGHHDHVHHYDDHDHEHAHSHGHYTHYHPHHHHHGHDHVVHHHHGHSRGYNGDSHFAGSQPNYEFGEEYEPGRYYDAQHARSQTVLRYDPSNQPYRSTYRQKYQHFPTETTTTTSAYPEYAREHRHYRMTSPPPGEQYRHTLGFFPPHSSQSPHPPPPPPVGTGRIPGMPSSTSAYYTSPYTTNMSVYGLKNQYRSPENDLEDSATSASFYSEAVAPIPTSSTKTYAPSHSYRPYPQPTYSANVFRHSTPVQYDSPNYHYKPIHRHRKRVPSGSPPPYRSTTTLPNPIRQPGKQVHLIKVYDSSRGVPKRPKTTPTTFVFPAPTSTGQSLYTSISPGHVDIYTATDEPLSSSTLNPALMDMTANLAAINEAFKTNDPFTDTSTEYTTNVESPPVHTTTTPRPNFLRSRSKYRSKFTPPPTAYKNIIRHREMHRNKDAQSRPSHFGIKNDAQSPVQASDRVWQFSSPVVTTTTSSTTEGMGLDIEALLKGDYEKLYGPNDSQEVFGGATYLSNPAMEYSHDSLGETSGKGSNQDGAMDEFEAYLKSFSGKMDSE